MATLAVVVVSCIAIMAVFVVLRRSEHDESEDDDGLPLRRQAVPG